MDEQGRYFLRKVTAEWPWGQQNMEPAKLTTKVEIVIPNADGSFTKVRAVLCSNPTLNPQASELFCLGKSFQCDFAFGWQNLRYDKILTNDLIYPILVNRQAGKSTLLV